MAGIPTSDWSRLNDAADRFERAWKTGPRPRIEDYLAGAEPGLRAALLEELLRVERELRREDGEDPGIAEYSLRFAQDARVIRDVFGPGPDRSDATGPRPEPADTAALTPDGRSEPAPGTHVRYFGDYEIQAELGRGAMGVVYSARQISLNRPVALKMIRSAALASEDELRRFQNEAEAVAQLDHPHIVPIYEVGEHDGQRYFSMKLIAGPSLQESLSSFAADPKAAARLMVTVAGAVHHAHQRGILHRDLKPSNILLDDRGEPHVTDFGLAKRIQSDVELTESGAILGTPAYMSPEQAAGRRGAITTATDVYGLGAILYALLTGKAPFRGQSFIETLDAVRNLPPEPITKQNPKIPRDLELICLKCMEKDPAGRYPTAGALVADLERFAAGEPVSVRAAGAVERLAKWTRRKPILAAAYALGLLALLFGGLGGVAVWQWRAASAAREALAWVEYGRTMELAYQEWREDNVPSAVALLESTRPDLRGWEWRYVHRLCHSNLLTLKGHTGAVTSASFSRDGSRIITTSSDQTAKVWDARTGHELATLHGLTSDRDSVSISPGGLFVITANRHGPGWPRARMWDARTGAEVPWFNRLTYPANSAAFSPDGARVVATCDDNTARVWDAQTGAEVLRLEGKITGVLAASFSPDGSRIVTGSRDGTAKVWDARTGAEIVTLEGHSRFVHSAWFSPDGARVVIAGYGGTQVWDARTGAEVVLRGPTFGAPLMSFSPDGSRIVTAGNNTARVYDARTGAEVLTLRGHTGGVNWARFSPDGSRIVAAGLGWTRLWDARTGAQIAALKGGAGRPESASFSPDGSWAVTLDHGMARVWDSKTGAEVFKLKGHAAGVSAASFSPDGSRIVTASADHTARVWDAKADAETATIKGRLGIGVGIAPFSPDGSRIVTANEDNIAQVWDARTGIAVLTLRGHNRFVRSASFSPDGSRILTVSDDNTAQVWDARTGAEVLILRGHTRGDWWAWFSPDGARIVATCPFGTQLWDARTGAEIVAFEEGLGRGGSAAFSPDGSRVVIISGNAASVRDARTGAEIVTLNGHAYGIEVTWFSPDGMRILTRGRDGTAKVWDARTGIAVLSFDGRNDSVAWFSSDQWPIISSSRDGTAKVWDVGTGAGVLTLKGHTRGVGAAWFSPDRSRILTAGADETVRVWDARTGIAVLTLRGYTGHVGSAAFSPDASRIVIAAGNDSTATVWDARTGAEVFRLRGHTGAVRWARFSPDGSRIVTADADETVKVWDATPISRE
jgi:WD40 repeat protein